MDGRGFTEGLRNDEQVGEQEQNAVPVQTTCSGRKPLFSGNLNTALNNKTTFSI
jgi:hypothetical protein